MAAARPVRRSSWRFFLDHNVPASVARMLRKEGHQCWTAGEAGLTESKDDSLTVYADERGAVLVTMDREFSQRRRKRSIGRHIWLRCSEPEAGDVLRSMLGDVLPLLEIANVTITVSADHVQYEHMGVIHFLTGPEIAQDPVPTASGTGSCRAAT